MAEEMVDVRQAAALVGRHPETVRRWVWSGRLAARREGNRLRVSSSDLMVVAGAPGEVVGLEEWSKRARRARDAIGVSGSGRSAADLVLEDRADRSRSIEPRAGR